MPGLSVSLREVSGRHPAARQDAPYAISDLSLQIAAGEQLAVIGPSGAGKTTLLQLIGAALKPSTGSVQVDGVNVWQLSSPMLQKLRGRFFYAPQVPPLPPRQRVVTALLAGRLPSLSLAKTLAQLIYPRDVAPAQAALESFDLADKLWHRVDRLSGGERQRVGLARGLVSPAELWLIDEPLSALDPTRARQAIQTLITEAKRRGVTLIVTLHQVDVARQNFPRIIGLRDGALAFDSPSAEVTQEKLSVLYAQHEHELTELAPPAIDIAPPPEPAKIVHCR